MRWTPWKKPKASDAAATPLDPPPEIDVACANCMFWRPYDRHKSMLPTDPHTGDCRRRAPTRGKCGLPEWPETMDKFWCGEFRPRSEPQNPRVTE